VKSGPDVFADALVSLAGKIVPGAFDSPTIALIILGLRAGAGSHCDAR
jgi:hypothetical protein